MSKTVRVILPAAVLVAFATFIWPTPWDYFPPPSNARHPAWLLRRNRFTGAVDWLGREGWTRCDSDAATPPRMSSPPAEDAADRFAEYERRYGTPRDAVDSFDEIERRYGAPRDAAGKPETAPPR